MSGYRQLDQMYQKLRELEQQMAALRPTAFKRPRHKSKQRFTLANQLNILEIQEIMALLPHRYPFLMIDRVLDFTPGESLTAIKNVTINEPIFTGHFPGLCQFSQAF